MVTSLPVVLSLKIRVRQYDDTMTRPTITTELLLILLLAAYLDRIFFFFFWGRGFNF